MDVAPLTTQKRTYWNPDGTFLEDGVFSRRNQQLREQYAVHQAHPGRALRNILILSTPLAILIVLTALSLFAPTLFPGIGQFARAGPKIVIFLYMIAVGVPAIYLQSVRNLQRDLIKLLIAEKKGWLYSPDEDARHWVYLKTRFPEFFERGNEGRHLEDEFWGQLGPATSPVSSYCGIFHYQVVTRGARGRRNTRTYRTTVFAVRLNKKITADFRLVPEGFFTTVTNFFHSNEIHTESAEFNRSFAFYYGGTKLEKQQDIIRVLSPAVQMSLLAMKEKKGPFSVLFREETALFLFEADLFAHMKTNFFRSSELDPRDAEYMDAIMSEILGLAAAIVPYLD